MARRWAVRPLKAHPRRTAAGVPGISAPRGVKAQAENNNRPMSTSRRTRMAKDGIEGDRVGYDWRLSTLPPDSNSCHILRRYDAETGTRSCFEK